MVDVGVSEKKGFGSEIIDCPFCGKGKIKVTHISGYISWRTSSISSGSKRNPYRHGPKTIVENNCPNCGKGKKAIKERLISGKPPSHEEIIKRAREAGLPLKIK